MTARSVLCNWGAQFGEVCWCQTIQTAMNCDRNTELNAFRDVDLTSAARVLCYIFTAGESTAAVRQSHPGLHQSSSTLWAARSAGDDRVSFNSVICQQCSCGNTAVVPPIPLPCQSWINIRKTGTTVVAQCDHWSSSSSSFFVPSVEHRQRTLLSSSSVLFNKSHRQW